MYLVFSFGLIEEERNLEDSVDLLIPSNVVLFQSRVVFV